MFLMRPQQAKEGGAKKEKLQNFRRNLFSVAAARAESREPDKTIVDHMPYGICVCTT